MNGKKWNHRKASKALNQDKKWVKIEGELSGDWDQGKKNLPNTSIMKALHKLIGNQFAAKPKI